MVDDVRIHMIGPKFDVTGAKIVDGFPSVGLVSTIAAHYLIEIFKLEQIGILDGPQFPTISVVHDGKPMTPARIYGGERPAGGKMEKLVVFVSEFQPLPNLARAISEAMLAWAREHKADYIISPEGMVLEGPEADDDKVDVYGIGATERMQKLVKDLALPKFRQGIITGVSGMLLNLGARDNFDVLAILAEAHANYPDARSAAGVIDVIGKLLKMPIDTTPLHREAERFETQIKTLQAQANAKQRGSGTTQPQMYS